MTDSNSTEYYRGRERHARGLAQAAVDPAVARIHFEMAGHYAELVRDAAPVLVTTQETIRA